MLLNAQPRCEYWIMADFVIALGIAAHLVVVAAAGLDPALESEAVEASNLEIAPSTFRIARSEHLSAICLLP